MFYAGMAELADVQDLGSCAARRVGSTPTTRTSKKRHPSGCLFFAAAALSKKLFPIGNSFLLFIESFDKLYGD